MKDKRKHLVKTLWEAVVQGGWTPAAADNKGGSWTDKPAWVQQLTSNAPRTPLTPWSKALQPFCNASTFPLCLSHLLRPKTDPGFLASLLGTYLGLIQMSHIIHLFHKLGWAECLMCPSLQVFFIWSPTKVVTPEGGNGIGPTFPAPWLGTGTLSTAPKLRTPAKLNRPMNIGGALLFTRRCEPPKLPSTSAPAGTGNPSPWRFWEWGGQL